MKKFTLLLMLCTPVALADQIAASAHKEAKAAPAASSNKVVKPPAAAPQMPNSLKITVSDTVEGEQIPKLASFGAQTLTRTGSGMRKKYIFAKVYRATLLVSDSAKFSKKTEGTVALDSLSAMSAVTLVLDFKRNIAAKEVASSFDAALKKNKINDSPALIQFKTTVSEGGDVVEGQRVTLSATKDTLTCEWGKKIVEIKGDAKFIRDVFSIWLGIPVDDGLKKLREALILGT